MTDYFALLGEPHQPWLDADLLKEKYHRLTARHHPDVAGANGADFSNINAAYQTLRDPVRRLRHFLQLEFPEALSAPQNMPEKIVELFLRIGAQKRNLEEFLAREERASSPLLRASLAGAKMRLLEDVEKLLRLAQTGYEGLAVELRALDWQNGPSEVGDHLAKIHQSLAFFGKWIDQLRGDIARLQT